MADVATRLRTLMIADATIAALTSSRIHQDHVPQSSSRPFVWFGRSGTEDIRTLDATAGAAPFSHRFDMEAVSEDVAEAQDLAAAVKAKLNNYRGAFDDSTVKGIFVEDHDDTYTPRSVYDDDGLFVAALSVEVIP